MGLQMELFWNLTPKEFHFVFSAWQDQRESVVQTSWEQTRMLLYYQYCSWPKKNKNPTYTRFKLEHIPFPWDMINKETVDEDEEPKEQPISPDQWLDIISNLKKDS
jgi:hypothetical protein